jgi:hypothetical protein
MGVIIYGVSLKVRPQVVDEDMKIDERDIVWPVFRRESREPGKRGLYHFMGIGVATNGKTAKEMAIALCSDETYFTFSVPVNVALPENLVFPRDLIFPKKVKVPK